MPDNRPILSVSVWDPAAPQTWTSWWMKKDTSLFLVAERLKSVELWSTLGPCKHLSLTACLLPVLRQSFCSVDATLSWLRIPAPCYSGGWAYWSTAQWEEGLQQEIQCRRSPLFTPIWHTEIFRRSLGSCKMELKTFMSAIVFVALTFPENVACSKGRVGPKVTEKVGSLLTSSHHHLR